MSATGGHLDQVKLEDDNLIYLGGRGHYKPDTCPLGTYEISLKMAVRDGECLVSIILWKNREPEQSTLYQIDIIYRVWKADEKPTLRLHCLTG